MRARRRKGDISIPILITIILGIVAFIIAVAIFAKQIGKGNSQAMDWLSSTNDHDGDGTADFFDKCACESGSSEFNGCQSESQMISQSPESIAACKKRIQDATAKKP